MLKEKNTTQMEVRQWVQDAIDGVDGVDLAKLSNDAVDHFMADEDFVRRELGGVLRPLVYEIARNVLKATRQEAVVNLGQDEIVTREEHKRRSNQLAKRFIRWMEHAGEDGHVRLMKMRKKQLLTAANERRKRGETELKIAAFEEQVARGLSSDTEVVEERYSAEDLEGIWEQIEAKGANNGRV
jgi:hypothetical protein